MYGSVSTYFAVMMTVIEALYNLFACILNVFVDDGEAMDDTAMRLLQCIV